ncbi:ATP-binding cassette domain-containing protein [Tundrisphaera sp. TA3]|uniref:ABC transporter ATP-binding protein n=1 Tax=Tundrisphaera sp. TA3 TaxID=3435775 RepID=UPI003EBBAE95
MLEVRGLRKRFGGAVALSDISFRVAAGEAVALLGPNGAGKTTTASIVCGLLRPDAGEVLFEGRPTRPRAEPLKRNLGLVPQELALVEELTARANLRFFGALQGLGGEPLRSAIARCLDLVGLATRADDPVRAFSGGMKRRLNLAAALIHDPRLIVLDEPTVGVDPQSRNAIFDGLEALKAEGKALLYATHYMEEAERLCDRAVIIDHGRVVADGDLGTLRGALPAATRLSLTLGDGGHAAEPDLGPIRLIPGVLAAGRDGDRVVVDLVDLRPAPRVLDALLAGGAEITHLASERPDLQTIFLDLTGRGLRDG